MQLLDIKKCGIFKIKNATLFLTTIQNAQYNKQNIQNNMQINEIQKWTANGLLKKVDSFCPIKGLFRGQKWATFSKLKFSKFT